MQTLIAVISPQIYNLTDYLHKIVAQPNFNLYIVKTHATRQVSGVAERTFFIPTVKDVFKEMKMHSEFLYTELWDEDWFGINEEHVRAMLNRNKPAILPCTPSGYETIRSHTRYSINVYRLNPKEWAHEVCANLLRL